MEHHITKTITAGCALLVVLMVSRPTVSALPRQQGGMQNLLARWYEQGERVSYLVTASNKDRAGTSGYTATARSVVKRDDMGHLFEEFAWSDLVSNGMPVQIPPADQQFRPILSLQADQKPAIPDVSRIHPRLVGPMFDLLAFYADAWVLMQQPSLRRQGDRSVVFNHGDTSSWADGMRVVLGEDSTDLSITIDDLNLIDGTATLTVLHEPPAQPKIRVPAAWMGTRVADVANNWTQVVRAGARQFVASVGKETFEVKLQMSLPNGKIYSGRMENTVDVFERECTDQALTMCNQGTRYQISRQIAIAEGP